ncbi:MAG: hypothetical protein NXI04_29670 [Planctomycetaceae bacterium]|nr:hypothetical protein [Planctomycetaceae bacterium]
MVAKTARQSLTVVVDVHGIYGSVRLVIVWVEIPALPEQPYTLAGPIRLCSLPPAEKSEKVRPNR